MSFLRRFLTIPLTALLQHPICNHNRPSNGLKDLSYQKFCVDLAFSFLFIHIRQPQTNIALSWIHDHKAKRLTLFLLISKDNIFVDRTKEFLSFIPDMTSSLWLWRWAPSNCTIFLLMQIKQKYIGQEETNRCRQDGHCLSSTSLGLTNQRKRELIIY